MRIVDELSTVIAVASTEPRENTRRNKPRWKEACHPQRASTEPRENTRRNLREDDLVRISLHASTEPRENTRRNTQYCGSVHKLRQLQRSRVKTRGGIKGLEGIYFEGVVNGFASGGGVWSGGGRCGVRCLDDVSFWGRMGASGSGVPLCAGPLAKFFDG